MPLSSTIPGATQITLGSATTINDSVSGVGYLKFVLTKPTSVDFGLSGGSYDMAIVNGSNTVVSVVGELLESKNSGTVAEKLNRILQKGTYYLRVTGTGNISLTYAGSSAFIADIVWRQSTTGLNFLNVQNNNGRVADLLTNPDTNWDIVEISDLNGDGYPDFIWSNNTTGEGAIWWMEGDQIKKSAVIPNPGNGWRLVGAADLNGDGFKDLIWRNIITGDNAVWFQDGSENVLSNNTALFMSLATSWEYCGAADFTGDGKDDIIWRNPSTGQNAVWYMNGASLSGSAFLPSVSGASWRIFGVGDFNGDGNPDLYWHNRATPGESAVWYMSGITLVSSAVLANIADFSFVPTAPYQRISQVNPGGSTLSTAFNLGAIDSQSVVSLSGHIGKFTGVNLYKFTIAANTSISSWVSANGFSNSYFAKAELLDSTGKVVSENPLFASLTPGTYYLRVSPVESTLLNLRYTLELVGINDPLPHVYVSTTGSDSNNGSISAPLATFNAALFAINGGGTIYVRGGTYNQFINFYPGLNGVKGKSMVLKAYQGEVVKVQNSSGTPINMGNVSSPQTPIRFVRVEGIEVLSSSNFGILGQNVQNGLIIGCTVHDTQKGGIAFYSTDNSLVGRHNAVMNCTVFRSCLENPLPSNPTQQQIQNKFAAGWDSGIVMSRQLNGLVQGNTVYEIGGEGTASTLSFGVYTLKNRFSDTFSSAIYLDNAIRCKADSNHLYSTNNPAYYFPQTPAAGVTNLAMFPNSGITLANEKQYPERNGNNNTRNCRGNVVTNNIVANSGIALTIRCALVDSLIAHNTLYQGVLGMVVYETLAVSTDATGHANSAFENNLIQQTNGAYGCGNRLNTSNADLNGITRRNNLMFGASLNDFAGSGDVLSNPLLVNPGAYTNRDNFKIQSSSPARNSGFTEPLVLADAYGTTRPQGSSYDIGSHEFV